MNAPRHPILDFRFWILDLFRVRANPKSKIQNPKSSRRLRPRERALANALDQLRQGVPLNWAQMEDDPELAVLVSLQSAAMQVLFMA